MAVMPGPVNGAEVPMAAPQGAMMPPAGAPAPTPPAPAQGQKLTWDDTVKALWTTHVDLARRKRDEIAQKFDWQGNLDRYTPTPDAKDVNVMADFRDVERKKAALFYDTPTIALSPYPETPPEVRSAIHLHQRVLNTLLAAQPMEGGVGALNTVRRAIFDVLCPSGVGPTRLGYGTTTVEVWADPMTGEPSKEPIEGVEPIQVPIHEQLFLATESPMGLLLPANLRVADTEMGAFIGVEWRRPVSQVRAQYHKPEDWNPGATSKAPFFSSEQTGVNNRTLPNEDPEIGGITFYFKASLFAYTGVRHPDLIGMLEYAEGDDGEPLIHELLAWQTVGPDGQLTPDSFRGFPIDPLMVRDLTDSPWVPSDCAVTAALTKEENRGRTVQQEVRKDNKPMWLYDPQELPSDQHEAWQNGTVGTRIPVQPGSLSKSADGGHIIKQIAQLSMSRSSMEWEQKVERDRELALGIGGNQLGGSTPRKQTATESSIVQRNTDARFEQERQRCLAWYLRVVRKLDCLLHRYGAQIVPTLVGKLAAQQWQTQHAQVLGWHSYEILPDSGQYVDIEARRRQKMQLLNLVGKSPNVNTVPIIADIVQDFGYDPTKVVIEQPPKPGPEPPKITISAEMLNPGLPQFDIILEIMRATGYQISDQAVEAARAKSAIQAALVPPLAEADTPVGSPPPQIPGTLPPMDKLNQKQSEETGELTGPGPRIQ